MLTATTDKASTTDLSSFLSLQYYFEFSHQQALVWNVPNAVDMQILLADFERKFTYGGLQTNVVISNKYLSILSVFKTLEEKHSTFFGIPQRGRGS